MTALGFDPLNPPQLRREDRPVAGCSCGGLQWHTLDCTLRDVDPEQRQAAIEDAERVVERHCEMLNGLLRAWMDANHGG